MALREDEQLKQQIPSRLEMWYGEIKKIRFRVSLIFQKSATEIYGSWKARD